MHMESPGFSRLLRIVYTLYSFAPAWAWKFLRLSVTVSQASWAVLWSVLMLYSIWSFYFKVCSKPYSQAYDESLRRPWVTVSQASWAVLWSVLMLYKIWSRPPSPSLSGVPASSSPLSAASPLKSAATDSQPPSQPAISCSATTTTTRCVQTLAHHWLCENLGFLWFEDNDILYINVHILVACSIQNRLKVLNMSILR